jgi:4-amino-4-deoxy-L-arabinose transferase-like glycosyltransferase
MIVLLIAAPVLVFHNLSINPRPWTDEGAYLSLAKTLATDGVYATHSSEGYQTFGAVQSAGPTLILPMALVFKVLGVGLTQGRAVAAIYALLTLAMYFLVAAQLFGRRAALVAVFLLLGTPAVRFLFVGRQALAEMPALGFFLAGWLAWSRSISNKRRWLIVIAGLLFGCAMVTKSQYVLLGMAALICIAALDRLYYHQHQLTSFIIIGAISLACVAVWWLWQIAYFGVGPFQLNAAKLGQLAASTSGFNLHLSADALRFLLSAESGQFYYFWGFPALAYAIILARKRDSLALMRSFLLIFACLWLGYWVLWSIPWRHYALPAMVITGLFVTGLWHDMTGGFTINLQSLRQEITQVRPGRAVYTTLGVTALVLTLAFQLQTLIRFDVLGSHGTATAAFWVQEDLQAPMQTAALLQEIVPKGAVVETFDRELDVLTDLQYHFPDSVRLAAIHGATYRGRPAEPLGAAYFAEYRPAYLVLGWYARTNGVYDPEFVAQHGSLLATVGEGVYRYEIYKLDQAISGTAEEPALPWRG